MKNFVTDWIIRRITTIGVIPWLIATLVAVLAVVAPDIVQLLHEETREHVEKVPHVVQPLKP